MVEAVAQHGYQDVTVAELVALAGVSKATLYKHYKGKQDCFLATHDTIAEISAERVRTAYRDAEGFEGRLRAGFEAFVELAIAEPAAASLILIDSPALGEAAVEPRERLAASYERMFRQSFGTGPGAVEGAAIRGIVVGVQRVTYRRLRSGESERLRDDVEPLLRWATSYVRDPGGPEPASRKGGRPRRATEAAARWQEPPNSARSRAELSHRERIVRAVAAAVAKRGYAELTIPTISTTAGISNQTFYECFSSKEEAFLAASQDIADLALEAVTAAFREASDWGDGIRAGLGALLAFLASNPCFARLTFIELPVAGRAAIEVADRQVGAFTALLLPPVLPEDRRSESVPLLAEAIGGAIWGLIQREVARDRVDRLPKLAAVLARVALQPYERPHPRA